MGELVTLDEKKASVIGNFVKNEDNKQEFRVVLELIDKDKVKKTFFVNKIQKPPRSYLRETTKSVLFSPEQILIINGSPEYRRNYIDSIISTFDFEYKKSLNNYNNALRKRNRVLEYSQPKFATDSELSFWNEYLEKQSSYITKKREEYIKFLNTRSEFYDFSLSVKYLPRVLSRELLIREFDKEKVIKKTLIGPQRDEFIFFISKNKDGRQKDALRFGSRSEQRIILFWLKMNEAFYYQQISGSRPIVLLDDVFSEFDPLNKLLILNSMNNYQTILTTTDIELIDKIKFSKSIIRIGN